MSRGAGGRAAVGLAANVAMVVLLVPRSLPRPDLLDPASRAAEVTEFGLRTMATLLAGYLAIVFLGLLLTALRLVPSSIRALVDRWTARGIAGGLRRCVGLSALAIGVLPLRPLAADATELAPVLAPDDTAPPPTAAPRLVPVRPAGPTPTAPESAAPDPPVAEPEPAGPESGGTRPVEPGPPAPLSHSPPSDRRTRRQLLDRRPTADVGPSRATRERQRGARTLAGGHRRQPGPPDRP